MTWPAPKKKIVFRVTLFVMLFLLPPIASQEYVIHYDAIFNARLLTTTTSQHGKREIGTVLMGTEARLSLIIGI